MRDRHQSYLGADALVMLSALVVTAAAVSLPGAAVATTDLEFYTGTVNTLFYESLVSGNSVFDLLYETFNTTGILAVGAALFAASGKSNYHLGRPDGTP